ncbi:MAG: glycosyltransferase family 2 protein [Acidobacteriota bacterium]
MTVTVPHEATIVAERADARARPADWPTFSIVLETENLAAAGPEAILEALGDLRQQDVPLEWAEEVIVLNSGDVPAELVEPLRQTYPWVRVEQLDGASSYDDAKAEGARRATGELVFFMDSDCRYGHDWLRLMTTPFMERPEIGVVSGETTVEGNGLYGLATLLTWCMPPFSNRRTLYRSGGYLFNAVAFRRAILQRYPLPDGMTVRRGHGTWHHELLLRAGYPAWCQPRARALHGLPSRGFSQFCWRWLVFGHDLLMTEQVIWTERLSRRWLAHPAAWTTAFVKIVSFGSWKPLRRLPFALRDEPRRVVRLPATVPVIWGMVALAMAGLLAATVRPGAVARQATRHLP